MKNRLKSALIMGSLGLALGLQSAQAGPVNVELLGNATYSLGTGTSAPVSGLGLPGFGLNLDFNLSSKVALQVGAHYLTRLFTTDAAYTYTYLTTNFGFKFMFSRAFSLILGGYYNHPYTMPLALLNLDIGVSAGLGLAIPLGSSLDLLISPTYHYALHSLDFELSGLNITPSEVVVFVGFVLGGSPSK